MIPADWSKAPSWAGCVIRANGDGDRTFWAEPWGTKDGMRQSTTGVRRGICDVADTSVVNGWILVENRPWNGEGLPPVGRCELRIVAAGSEWHEADIKFASRNVAVWDWVGEPAINGLCTGYVHTLQFRPIRTPEQIAAEENEKAARDLYYTINWNAKPGEWDSINPNRRLDYLKAIQAGYRKPVIATKEEASA